ncbi:DUF4436 family protein [Kitasatospora sp. NPDC127067]|uniref:DUF4436 family protein n=1 Tax=Kitasatospora sp. NPDC127067 TaxID=3347126 RepID=UPI00365E8CB7
MQVATDDTSATDRAAHRAPGSPPIGSLIDYVAFSWAEGVIAAGLACTAWSGIRTEHRLRREREAAAEGP